MTFFNKESEWKFYMEEIVSLNNNLLINNDVSLNGNLNISGTLGVGESQDVGTAGAVLTSNGAGSSVSWNRPYFMKALLTTNIYGNTTPRLEGMTEFEWSAPFGGATGHWSATNETKDQWTCPQTGIYRITLQVEFESSSDNISFALGFLRKNNGAVILRSENYFGTDASDTLLRATVNATSILEIQLNDTIRMDFGIETEGGSVDDVHLKGSGEDATFLIIERVL